MRVPGMAVNREDAVEGSLQTFILALFGRSVSLQECGERFQLGGQQEWNRQSTNTLRKTFTDTFFFGKRVAHIISTIKGQQSCKAGITAGYAFTKDMGQGTFCEPPLCGLPA
jgi:hypothetical protein